MTFAKSRKKTRTTLGICSAPLLGSHGRARKSTKLLLARRHRPQTNQGPRGTVGPMLGLVSLGVDLVRYLRIVDLDSPPRVSYDYQHAASSGDGRKHMEKTRCHCCGISAPEDALNRMRWVSTPDGSAQTIGVESYLVCEDCADAGSAYFDEDGQPQGTGYLPAGGF